MIWRRYRSTVGWAVAASTLIGALCGLAVCLAGNSDYRAQSGWVGFLYWLALGAVFGCGTGLAAILGGFIAIVSRDRSLARTRSSRAGLIATGATIGAGLLWLALAVITAATGGAGYWPIFLGIAVVAGLVTAVSARILLHRLEGRPSNDAVIDPAESSW